MRYPNKTLALFLCSLAIAACNPTGSGEAARSSGQLDVDASGSVRVNGRPLARAATGDQAGKALLAGACTAGDALEHSPNVRIDGAPATVVKPGADLSECRADGDVDTADNVRVGG